MHVSIVSSKETTWTSKCKNAFRNPRSSTPSLDMTQNEHWIELFSIEIGLCQVQLLQKWKGPVWTVETFLGSFAFELFDSKTWNANELVVTCCAVKQPLVRRWLLMNRRSWRRKWGVLLWVTYHNGSKVSIESFSLCYELSKFRHIQVRTMICVQINQYMRSKFISSNLSMITVTAIAFLSIW